MDTTFEIKKKIGTIATYPSGWSKELTLTSWNGRDPKFDIRDWGDDHKVMSRGITLTEDEMRTLYNLLKEFFEGGKYDDNL